MGVQDDYNRAYEDGVSKACEVIAEAIREWASPAACLGNDVAMAIAVALDTAKIGANGYIFRSIVNDTPTKWKQVDEARYDEMLGVLPPIAWVAYGFLVGEAWDHHPTKGYSRYQAMLARGGKYYESTRPLGVKEWKSLDFAVVDQNIVP